MAARRRCCCSGLSDMHPLLDHFRFETQASVSEGEFVLRQSELNLVAGGETFEQAASELEELAVAYAEPDASL